MKEVKIQVEKIENGLLVKINDSKQYFFKNSWGIGKYIQEKIEEELNNGHE